VYPWFARFWNYVEREASRTNSRRIHAILYHAGYQYQLSLYGTLKEPYDGKHTAARIELLSTQPFTVTDILRYRETFRHFVVTQEYTLIAVTREGLKEVV
jgi:hypothetical protein